MTRHAFQSGTIAELRQVYETHAKEADETAKRARALLAAAGAHAALARDAAKLLEHADPAWTGEQGAPAVARILQLRAWREAIDYLEQNPELGISDYHTIALRPAEGDETPEWVASLEQYGISVERGQRYIRAERYFGAHTLSIYASVRIGEQPAAGLPAAPVDPVGALPAPAA